MDIQLEATFIALKALLYPYQHMLYVTRNDSCRYFTKLSSPPCFGFQASFADIRRTQHSVSFILHPLKKCCFADEMFSSLNASRQSATTFILTSIGQREFDELASLTQSTWTTVYGLLAPPTKACNLTMLMSADPDSFSRFVN